MNYIIGILAVLLGYLMDLFFQGLTLIGYPRVWACIVLYAAFTRFFFLPQRINNYKKKLLTPVVNRELLSIDPNFFVKSKDTKQILERNALKKQYFKKYGISNRSGFLMTLIQYPFLVALFYVVKHPQDFIPSLEALASVSANVNTFLGLSLAAIPLNSLHDASTPVLLLCVPFLVVLSNILKMLRSLKLAKTVSQKIKVYSLCGLFTVLLGWLSASLPLAISIYWLTNDITYAIFDFFIRKQVPKSPVVVAAMKDHKERLRQLRAEQEAAAEQPKSADLDEIFTEIGNYATATARESVAEGVAPEGSESAERLSEIVSVGTEEDSNREA